MATSVTKTYTISVAFTKGDSEYMTAVDVQTVIMRDYIKKIINQITKVSCGRHNGIRTAEVVET